MNINRILQRIQQGQNEIKWIDPEIKNKSARDTKKKQKKKSEEKRKIKIE